MENRSAGRTSAQGPAVRTISQRLPEAKLGTMAKVDYSEGMVRMARGSEMIHLALFADARREELLVQGYRTKVVARRGVDVREDRLAR